MITVAVFLTVLLLESTGTAAPFRNLDFEEANTNNLTLDSSSGFMVGRVEDLLPGWKVFNGPLELQTIPFLPLSPLQSAFDFQRSKSFIAVGTRDRLLNSIDGPSGKYALYVYLEDPAQLRLIQSGEVPAWAEGLTGNGYEALNGVELPEGGYTRMDGKLLEPTYSERGLDVSEFAGRNVELEFVWQGPKFQSGGSINGSDSIRFVPEPSPLSLGAAGLLIIVFGAGCLHRKCG